MPGRTGKAEGESKKAHVGTQAQMSMGHMEGHPVEVYIGNFVLTSMLTF